MNPPGQLYNLEKLVHIRPEFDRRERPPGDLFQEKNSYYIAYLKQANKKLQNKYKSLFITRIFLL